MKSMSVVFELDLDDEISYANKMQIYNLFSKVCKENSTVFLVKSNKEDIEGYLFFNKDNSDIVRKIVRRVNDYFVDNYIEYIATLPLIMDGIRFKVPTFYPDGKIKIIR